MEKLIDQHGQIRGILCYKVFRHINGKKELVDSIEDRNLIVNKAREQMAHLVAGDSVANRKISMIAFGTSGVEATLQDTIITSPFTKNIDGYSFPSQTQVRFNWSLSTSEGNGKAIREFGLITADNALFARRVRNSPINKESDISLEGTWTIIF